MAEGPLRGYHPTPGFAYTERPAEECELYATPDEMASLYDLTVSEEQLRAAQSRIDAYCHRTSLWPEEYTRSFRLMPDRNVVILPARPIIQITDAKGRYNYGRRDHLSIGSTGYDTLAAIALTRGPGNWLDINVEQLDVNGATGEVWLQPGLFLTHYSEVILTWTSGLVQMPARIKLAMAEVVHQVCVKGGASDRTRYRVGRIEQQFSGNSFITEEAARLLSPYVITSLF